MTGTLPNADEYQAHDLLQLCALPEAGDMPAWLPSAFADAPFAVVRRARAPGRNVAVGFRGTLRAQRYGTFIERGLIITAQSPEHLLVRPIRAGRSSLKAFTALRAIVEEGDLGALVWGPTGSVGFELATGAPAATASSDLDLLIRTPARLGLETAQTICRRLKRIEETYGVRVDAQLDTPSGGVALSEWAQDKPRVMVRSTGGPSLVADPWTKDETMIEALR